MYTQAGIEVKNAPAFGELKAAIDGAFMPADAGAFLRKMEKSGLRVRDFEGVLRKKLLKPAQAKELYESLPASDQAQIREHYLTRVEQVDGRLRGKFKKLYAFY
jgi:hypothetical protein